MQYAVQMRNCRICLFSGFGLLLTLGFLVTRGDAQPDSFKEIVKGVWFREGDLTGKGHCNNIFIEMKDYLVVVDANFPSGARQRLPMFARYRKSLCATFSTHIITAITHTVMQCGRRTAPRRLPTKALWKRCSDTSRSDGRARRKSGRCRRFEPSDGTPPEKTFDKSPFIVKDETRTIEFHHFGWAHTRGDGFAYLPAEKILCTGDAATNGPTISRAMETSRTGRM